MLPRPLHLTSMAILLHLVKFLSVYNCLPSAMTTRNRLADEGSEWNNFDDYTKWDVSASCKTTHTPCVIGVVYGCDCYHTCSCMDSSKYFSRLQMGTTSLDQDCSSSGVYWWCHIMGCLGGLSWGCSHSIVVRTYMYWACQVSIRGSLGGKQGWCSL